MNGNEKKNEILILRKQACNHSHANDQLRDDMIA